MNERGESGVLILVAGPSGSGKDTLLNFARQALAADENLFFPKRVITRSDTSGEDHLTVTPIEFGRLERDGAFFLSWNAHGFDYGIPISVFHDLWRGRAVIVNVSRRVVDEARMKWAATAVISIVVAPEILRQRLLARGRESEVEIDARVRRATDEACAIKGPVHIFDNSPSLDETGAKFVALLAALRRAARSHEIMTA